MAVLKVLVPVSAACLLSYWIRKEKLSEKWRILKLLPLLPAWMALLRKLRPGSLMDRSFVATGHCLYHLIVSTLFIKWIPLEYGLLCIYLPMPIVFERKSFGLNDIASHNDIFYKYYIQYFWSLPIISSMKLLSNIYRIMPTNIISIDNYINHGIQSPLISIINDDICVGRLPLNNYDVDIIRNEPYNIGAIINMCIEATGPTHEYQKYDIKYLHLKTTDTLPPKLNDIKQAMEFIEEFVSTKDNAISELEMENNKRILIHCRGGRSRSATVALCWLLTDLNITIKEAMKLLTSKRKAVHPKIEYYHVVYEYGQTLTNNMIVAPPPTHQRVLSFHLMD